jgi:hypothetical protein
MVHRGLVRDGVIVLEGGSPFPEGTVVTVQAAVPPARVAVPEQVHLGLPDGSTAESVDRLLTLIHQSSNDDMRAQQRLDRHL